MINATEWLDKGMDNVTITGHDKYAVMSVETIRQIQLDAFKAGLLMAAAMTYTEHSYDDCACWMQELEKEIKARADSLKELP